jgi:hypothetical protein
MSLDHFDVLFRRSYRHMVGKRTFEIKEPSIRQYFANTPNIYRLIYAIAFSHKMGVNKFLALHFTTDLIMACVDVVRNSIDYNSEVRGIITPRQAIIICRQLINLIVITRKHETPSGNGKGDSTLLTICEKFSAVYGWFVDDIVDKMTMRQLYAYWEEQSKRESKELELRALLHGHKIKSSSSDSSIEDAMAKKALGGERYDPDEVSQILQVNKGDLPKLKKLLLFMGIQYPTGIDFVKHEESLRNILFQQVKTIKDKGRWEYPDYTKDISEQVLGVKRGDIEGLQKLASDLGMAIDVNQDWRKNEIMLKQLLIVSKRRKEQFLVNVADEKYKQTEEK